MPAEELHENRLAEAWAFQAECLALDGVRETYVPLSREELEEILAGRGRAFAWVGDQGIEGLFCLLYPGEREENLLRGYLPRGQWPLAAHFEVALVHPRARGRGIHRAMTRLLIEEAAKQGCRYLCATVSPDNPASFLPMLRSGFFIYGLEEKYGGRLRYLLCREAAAPWWEQETVCCPTAEIARQRALLSAGLRGTGFEEKSGGLHIRYQRPKAGGLQCGVFGLGS